MTNIPTKYRSVFICLALTFATAAVFYQVYTYDFVNYDDQIYVYENPNIQAGITLNSVKWAFTSGYAANWHPITWLSHMLDWQLFGSNPAGFHLTNLILHIVNTLLLFFVLKRMTNTLWQSAFVAALFALHPLHVESVAWVSERKDVLSTFFWLLTMWAYVRYCGNKQTPNIKLGAKQTYYLLTIIFFALGLMSKPMLVTLPFVLLLLDYWPLERLNTKRSLPYLLIEKIPLFVMAVISSIITFIVQKKSGATEAIEGLSLSDRLANVPISYVKYIIKMIWPARLAVLYPHPRQNVSFSVAVISAVVLLVITILIFQLAKNHRYLFAGWFWYLGTLVPVIGFVQVGHQAIADRYSYITLTGLFIIIAWGFPYLLTKWQYKKAALVSLSLLIISVMSVCTHIQLFYWRNSQTLFQHALDVTRNNYVAHYSLGNWLASQGKFDEAIYHYSQAIQIVPGYINALNNLGSVLQKEGKIDEAIGYYKRAIEINPGAAEPHANLGIALAASGKFEEAIRHYRIAMAETDVPRLHSDLGYALMKLGRFSDAAAEYEKVLIAQPQNVEVHNNFGIVLSRQERFDEAIEHFSKALQIDPNCKVARDNLNRALVEKQKRPSPENTKK
jgi:Tfp pilus assembly protein PilF